MLPESLTYTVYTIHVMGSRGVILLAKRNTSGWSFEVSDKCLGVWEGSVSRRDVAAGIRVPATQERDVIEKALPQCE